MIPTISAFENMAFGLEDILAMKDELDRLKAELNLMERTTISNRRRHAELKQAIACYTENIWPELANQNVN